jgi:hypothetical protein
MVWGVLDATLTGATVTALAASLSLTSATLAGQGGSYVSPARLYPEPITQALPNLNTATGTVTLQVGPTVLTVLPGQSTTLYLVGQAAFSAGTVAGYGSLFAYLSQ